MTYVHYYDGNGRTGRVLIVRELLSRGYAPLVIPIEKRHEYMNYLASRDVKRMSNMLKKLNEQEKKRMTKFGIKI